MKRFSILLIILVSFASCEKEKFSNDSVFGETAIKASIVDGPWVFKNEVVVYGPDDVDHGPAEECKTDDTWLFDISGEAIVNFGPIDCFQGTGFSFASGSYGTWELLSGGNELKVYYNRDIPGGAPVGEAIIWQVEYMSQKKMVLKRLVQEYGKSYTLYDTYIR